MKFETKQKQTSKQNTIKQYLTKNLLDFANDLTRESITNKRGGISAIITKPPESVFVHAKFDKIKDEFIYILYDSHPRTERALHGSHFLIFKDMYRFTDYLKLLFPYNYMFDNEFEQMTVQQFNCADVSMLKLKNQNMKLLTEIDDTGFKDIRNNDFNNNNNNHEMFYQNDKDYNVQTQNPETKIVTKQKKSLQARNKR